VQLLTYNGQLVSML